MTTKGLGQNQYQNLHHQRVPSPIAMPVIKCHRNGCPFEIVDVPDAVGALIQTNHLQTNQPKVATQGPRAEKVKRPVLDLGGRRLMRRDGHFCPTV